MPNEGEKLLRDLLTANRAYVSAVLEQMFQEYILKALPEELPGLEAALGIVRRYKAGEGK